MLKLFKWRITTYLSIFLALLYLLICRFISKIFVNLGRISSFFFFLLLWLHFISLIFVVIKKIKNYLILLSYTLIYIIKLCLTDFLKCFVFRVIKHKILISFGLRLIIFYIWRLKMVLICRKQGQIIMLNWFSLIWKCSRFVYVLSKFSCILILRIQFWSLATLITQWEIFSLF